MNDFLDFISLEPSTMIISILNLLLLFYILKRFLFKRIEGIIQKREKEVSELFEKANLSVNESQNLKKTYEDKLEDIHQERALIFAETQSEAVLKAESILKDSLENAARIKESSKREMAVEQQKILAEIKDEVAGISLSIAGKILEREIDEDKHKDIVAQFISDLELKNE